MPITSIFIVISALGILLGISAVMVKKGMIGGEPARKLVHVGMGFICMAFPWLFDAAFPVQILGLIAVFLILIIRSTKLKSSLGSSLFSVKRLSIGELLFPVAVAWLFTLNMGKPVVYYIIPLLLLTLADTAGALAGSRFGKRIYRTSAGEKSCEGSLAFFLTAFVCTLIPLLCFTTLDFIHVMYLAIAVALFITAVEGASGMGIDNLFIPIGCYFLLDYYSDLPTESLWIRVISLIALILLLVLTRRKHTLNGGAVLTAVLLCFIALMLGGWYCLTACLFILARHIMAMQKMPSSQRYSHSIDSVLAISAPAITWLILLNSETGASMFIASLAITIAMLHAGTQKFLQRSPLDFRTLATSLCLCALLAALTCPLLASWLFIFILLVLAILSTCLFNCLRSKGASSLNDWIWLCMIVSVATFAHYFSYEYFIRIL